MSLRILADENIPAVEHYVGALGTVQRFTGRVLQASDLASADVLLVRSVTRVDAALLAGAGIRFVGTATSGIDHIDRAYLGQRGIGFSRAPGANANSVVEYVLAAIAGVGQHLERILAGATVGIVGYGFIGKAMAHRLGALGIAYKVYDPWLEASEIDHPATLSEVLQCGVITLHAELTRQQPWPSYHLFNAATLGELPGGSLLINASRGSVVDNGALSDLLEKGSGPDVVLDVWEGEPGISEALLSQVQFGTPHIAGYSLDGKLHATHMLVEAMAHQLGLPWRDPGSAAGEAPPLSVPREAGDAALLRSLLYQRYDIAADDTALRSATLGAGPAEAAAGFDHLRRHYPQRREILGSHVCRAGLSPQAQGILRGMGCILVDPVP